MLASILAVDLNNAIGNFNPDTFGLCWKIKEDLQMFSQVSKKFKNVVAGTTTFNLLPNLKDREVFRLTKEPKNSFDITLTELTESTDDFLIIGGKETFISTIPFCEYIFLTRIHNKFPNCEITINIDDLTSHYEIVFNVVIATINKTLLNFQLLENTKISNKSSSKFVKNIYLQSIDSILNS